MSRGSLGRTLSKSSTQCARHARAVQGFPLKVAHSARAVQGLPLIYSRSTGAIFHFVAILAFICHCVVTMTTLRTKISYALLLRFLPQFLCPTVCVYGGSTVPRGQPSPGGWRGTVFPGMGKALNVGTLHQPFDLHLALDAIVNLKINMQMTSVQVKINH